ncbi:MAG: tryptophan-rich sensory protein, partial [Candidatus Levybacteria bacterium]|nr:tryptophan-rich sensory protein [Candidatus Levybacteria bacterium]
MSISTQQLYNKNMNTTYDWYQLLDKPSWAPPSWLFG